MRHLIRNIDEDTIVFDQELDFINELYVKTLKNQELTEEKLSYHIIAGVLEESNIPIPYEINLK